jgi:hypothetical protein
VDVGFRFAPGTPRAAFLDALHIETGPGRLTTAASHQLSATGFDSAGHGIAVHALTWRSNDTTIATIDSTGLLHPRRAGSLRVDASAGGWRRASAELTIADPTPRLLLEETWTTGLTPRWVPFGEPRPRIVDSGALGRAFHNAGDGSFFSGVYTADAFDVADGLWVGADISVPIREAGSQDQLLEIVADDPTGLAAWDHRTGDGVAGGRLGWCFLRFPAGQGVFRGDSIYASGSPGLQFPVRDGVKGGEPFRALVQLFPDGRCGYAVDGKPLHITRPGFRAKSGRVVVRGRSVGAEVVVGRLRVLSGVAPDLDWRVLETGASTVR